MPRDPRVDPRPGDYLRGKYPSGATCSRRVTGVTPLGNVFVRERGWGNKIIHPEEWRGWAINAAVVTVAEDPQTATEGPPKHAGGNAGADDKEPHGNA